MIKDWHALQIRSLRSIVLVSGRGTNNGPSLIDIS